MKIKVVGLLSMCSLVLGTNFSAFAACYSSEAGEYCLTNKRYTCPAGCYCEKAPGDYGALDRKGNGQKDIYQEDVAAWCKNGTECKWSGGTGQCGTSNDAKVFRCPADFPESENASKTEKDCYAIVGNKKLYNKVVTNCIPGTYLPINSDSCVSCKSGNFVCPGPGTSGFKPSVTQDQGIKECKSGEKPNAAKTACDKEEAEEAEASTGDISVQPGYYLPEKSKTQKQCSESTYYCPGGSYAESGEDQGKFKCPKNTTANQKRTACVARVPKSNLKTGPNPNTPTEFQCWMNVTDIEKYKLCVIANPYYK